MELFEVTLLLLSLKFSKDPSLDEEVAETRAAMLDDRARPSTAYDVLRRRALDAERKLLNDWRLQGRILDDVYHHLEDELDRTELDVAAPETSWLEN